MSRSYAREKFGSAVEHMATSPQSLHNRIYDAYVMFAPVQADDVRQGDEREIFDELYASLTREEAVGDEGRVRATLNKMSDDQASMVASLIVSLESRLSSED